MVRANYRFDDKFLFTLTGRADGSSRLAEGNKWAFFPAFSAGYILSEEELMQGSKISFLKVRGGYGEVGNTAISAYQTLGGLERTTYVFGSTAAFGYANNLIPNPDLKWEISKTMNLGLDLKGGINAILQISVKDILKGLANHTTNPVFNKALDDASELQKNSQDTYLEDFFKAFDAIKGDTKLASPDIFYTKALDGEIDGSMSDDDVKQIISRKIDESIVSAFEVLRKSID